jgi:dienelactone hydrolase
MKKIKGELVEITTEDKLFLPGMLFEPAKGTRKVLIVLHGNGSSSVFYKADFTNTWAEKLAKKGISYFTFNNRGAHYVKKLHRLNEEGEDERVKYGMAYELIKECVYDIDAAISFLRKRGYSEFYIIGFSTGANKICVYNYYKPENSITKYVLASGGDDTGIIYDQVGSKQKFFKYLKKAEKKINEGKGKDLVPKYILDWLISYQSFYDEANPDGDYNTFPFNEVINNLKLSKKRLFKEYKSIRKPTLVIYGDSDEYCYGDVGRVIDILKKEAPKGVKFSYKIIQNADHGFSGREGEMIGEVVSWLVS